VWEETMKIQHHRYSQPLSPNQYIFSLLSKFCWLGLLTSAISLSLQGSSSAASLVKSTFDTGLDGWTENADNQSPGDSFISTGGNPGGYLFHEDTGPGISNLIAPDRFLGDWSAYQSISYDHKVFKTGVFSEVGPQSMLIQGPGGSARWFGDVVSSPSGWQTFTAPLSEEFWIVDSGSWSKLLSEVSRFEIVAEHFLTVQGFEEEGYDNIALTPKPDPKSVPESATLLGLFAVAGLSFLTQRQKIS
jgi:hypothetical protein